ncbi:hypothetical protein SBI_04168 [Streptomyces bingchenggensis BCW-1]|uniref:Uncharacterized protein n=1 Tax=Streptomyces bingchenggensis (strain BCW-1) TaxID=749414 RepID=D7BRV2_STRBB|nr:hypothetical protein SBI_04168 [Streptomyces bingchenggensis BCW-1]
MAERTPARPLAADDATAGPVFVDLSGRRARLLRHAGMVAGAAVIGYTALLGTGFSGGTAVAPDTLAPGAGPGAAVDSAGRDAKDTRRGHPSPRKHSPGKPSTRKPSAKAGADRYADRRTEAGAR